MRAGAALESAFPVENKDQALLVRPVSRLSMSTSPESGDGAIGVLSIVLMSMAGVVLLIACLNLANMQLARGAARRKEFAIRASIGGGRLRATRQLLTEGLALSLPGALLALGISWASMRLLNLRPSRAAADSTRRSIRRRTGACSARRSALRCWRRCSSASGRRSRSRAPDLRDRAQGTDRRGAGGALAIRGAAPAGHGAARAQPRAAHGRRAVRARCIGRGASRSRLHARSRHRRADRQRASRATTRAARSTSTRARSIACAQLPGVTAVGFGSLMPFGEIHRGERRAAARTTARNFAARGSSGVGSQDGVVDGAATPSPTASARTSSPRSACASGADAISPPTEAFRGGPPVAIVDEALARQIFGDEDPIGRQLQINARERDVAPELVEIVGIAPPILHQMNDRARARRSTGRWRRTFARASRST